MAKIKLGLNRLSIPEKIGLADTVITAMTGNANFPNANPSMADLQTKRNASDNKSKDYDSKKQALDLLLTERNNAVAELETALTSEAGYVESTSGGDDAKIQSAGMDIRAQAAPVGPPAQPQNLSATAGDNDGEVDMQWDSARGAKTYEIQTSPDPITATSWQHRSTVTKSSATIGGLPSGTRCWFRVRAVGSAGSGPWSDPATKIVP